MYRPTTKCCHSKLRQRMRCDGPFLFSEGYDRMPAESQGIKLTFPCHSIRTSKPRAVIEILFIAMTLSEKMYNSTHIYYSVILMSTWYNHIYLGPPSSLALMVFIWFIFHCVCDQFDKWNLNKPFEKLKFQNINKNWNIS